MVARSELSRATPLLHGPESRMGAISTGTWPHAYEADRLITGYSSG